MNLDKNTWKPCLNLNAFLEGRGRAWGICKMYEFYSSTLRTKISRVLFPPYVFLSWLTRPLDNGFHAQLRDVYCLESLNDFPILLVWPLLSSVPSTTGPCESSGLHAYKTVKTRCDVCETVYTNTRYYTKVLFLVRTVVIFVILTRCQVMIVCASDVSAYTLCTN